MHPGCILRCSHFLSPAGFSAGGEPWVRGLPAGEGCKGASLAWITRQDVQLHKNLVPCSGQIFLSQKSNETVQKTNASLLGSWWIYDMSSLNSVHQGLKRSGWGEESIFQASQNRTGLSGGRWGVLPLPQSWKTQVSHFYSDFISSCPFPPLFLKASYPPKNKIL